MVKYTWEKLNGLKMYSAYHQMYTAYHQIFTIQIKKKTVAIWRIFLAVFLVDIFRKPWFWFHVFFAFFLQKILQKCLPLWGGRGLCRWPRLIENWKARSASWLDAGLSPLLPQVTKRVPLSRNFYLAFIVSE